MNSGSDILTLLGRLVAGECDRPGLAKWLAENCLRYYQSPSELDQIIVAELDAALGEVQDGMREESWLQGVATQLVNSLRLNVPGETFFVDVPVSQSTIIYSTSTAASSSHPAMAEVRLEEAPTYA